MLDPIRMISILAFFSCAPLMGFAEEPVIGALAELTGNFAKLGDDCRRGYEVAKARSTVPAKVVVADNQSDPKTAITEFRRLVGTEHASLVVTTRSPVGLALNPLSHQQKIPLVGIVGHPRFVADNPYAVRIFPSATDEAAALAAHANSRTEPTIAIVTLEDDYFLGLTKEFEKRLEKTKVVFSETVAPSEQEFGPLLSRIKGVAPGAVFVNFGAAQVLPFVKKLRELKIEARIYANFIIGSADIRRALGANADGIVFAELAYRKPGFLGALREVTGSSESSPIGYACYVGLSYGYRLVEESVAKKIPIAEAGAGITELATVDGSVTIVDREAKFEVLPMMVRNGEAVPADAR